MTLTLSMGHDYGHNRDHAFAQQVETSEYARVEADAMLSSILFSFFCIVVGLLLSLFGSSDALSARLRDAEAKRRYGYDPRDNPSVALRSQALQVRFGARVKIWMRAAGATATAARGSSRGCHASHEFRIPRSHPSDAAHKHGHAQHP